MIVYIPMRQGQVSKSLNIAHIIVIIVGTCLRLRPEKKNMSKTE